MTRHSPGRALPRSSFCDRDAWSRPSASPFAARRRKRDYCVPRSTRRPGRASRWFCRYPAGTIASLHPHRLEYRREVDSIERAVNLTAVTTHPDEPTGHPVGQVQTRGDRGCLARAFGRSLAVQHRCSGRIQSWGSHAGVGGRQVLAPKAQDADTRFSAQPLPLVGESKPGRCWDRSNHGTPVADSPERPHRIDAKREGRGRLAGMNGTNLAELASLLRDRNSIDERIGRLINRPMTAGHAGEWIASHIFDIELEPSAVAKAIDGHFRSGRLAGKTVNVKWYLKREGLLDMTEASELDYYLVLAGPKATSKDVRTVRAWKVDAVYLFDSQQLLDQQRARGVKIGVASGVRDAQWLAAELYPTNTNETLLVTKDQRNQLSLFRGDLGTSAV